MPNAYTFTLIDKDDLVPSSVEAEITNCAEYVISLVSRYLDWKGTLDFVVDIRPASELTWSDADGLLPSVAQLGWNGSAWVNETLEECLTGFDGRPNAPDAGCTIYLAADGTIKNYGVPVWFDPSPRFGVDPNVPAGTNDFVGIYTHEVFHSLGFYAVTKQWRDHIVEDVIDYFWGPQVELVYGAPLPFARSSDHYGDTSDPAIDISAGLMFQWGNYERNRLDIGRVDLAVLDDLGHAVKTYAGLPLFDMIDFQTDLAGSDGADSLYGDYHANTVWGRSGGDRIFGGAGSDVLFGEGADDFLFGEAGVDKLDGGPGNDQLDGGAGADTMAGGAGSDTYVVDQAGDTVTETSAAGGTDTVRSAVSYTLGANLERLTLTGTAANGTGNALGNVLTGNSAANGLAGGGGNDVLNGAAGADTMTGWAGDDSYFVDNIGDKVVESSASAGMDTVSSSVSFTLGAHIENLTLTGTAADGTGNALANALTGNGAANVLRGGAGADTLKGGGGADMLHGGDGSDTLRGGDGADRFIFDKPLGPANLDHILDFARGADKIVLENAVFKGLAAGPLTAGAFVVGTAAADAGDRIIYDPATGALLYDPDGTGAAAATRFAVLDTQPATLAASDFLVI